MPTASTLPNILWLCTDQQRYDTIAALGAPGAFTPNLDRLCAEGTTFTHAYCQNPISTPSRASFLTGLYPNALGVNQNGNCEFPDTMSRYLITRRLAEEAGYRCGLVGKLHLASAFTGQETRTHDGYTDWRYSHAPTQENTQHNQYHQWLRQQGADFDAVFHRNDVGQHAWYRADADLALHQSTWCAEQSIDLIQQYAQQDQPWLLSVNFFAPHPPFDAPDACCESIDADALAPVKWSEDEQARQERLAAAGVLFQAAPCDTRDTIDTRRRYAGGIAWIDQQVGRIIDCLERTGQRENTMIIFMSDHGEMLGDHGLVGKGNRFYDELVRVPLIVSWPQQFTGGRCVDHLVELTDIKPTLVELAGLAPDLTHGQSLCGYLDGTPREPRRFVRSEFLDTLNMHMPDHPERHTPSYGVMIRDDQHKLVVYPGTGLGELFDLHVDPDELNDRYDDASLTHARTRLQTELLEQHVMASALGPPRTARY